MAEKNELFEKLNNLLKNTDFSDVSADSSGFASLPDGFYLCEVESTELKESKSSHKLMVTFKFKIVEDGYNLTVTDDGDTDLISIGHTQNRKIFINQLIDNESNMKRFAANMLKFEESPGEPLLPKEAFTTGETLMDALDCLIGQRIYVQASTNENKDGTSSQWCNLISWKRASNLGLPVD